MVEKKRLKRRNLLYYLKVFDRDSNKQVGRMVDITIEGMMLISEKPFVAGYVFQCKMELPDEIGKGSEIFFNAKCAWCKKSDNPDIYDNGFQLLNVSQDDIEVIESLIRWFKF